MRIGDNVGATTKRQTPHHKRQDGRSKQLIHLLQQTTLFADFSDENLDIIVHFSEFVTCKQNEQIFNIGQEHQGMFVIQDGEVLVQKRGDNGKLNDVARFITGETFGETGLFRSSVLNVQAVAVQNCRLLQFPARKVSLSQIQQGYPMLFTNILHRLIAIVAGRIRSTNRLISENHRWVHQLRRQIFTDKLTGLFNNSYLQDDEYKTLFKGSLVTILMVKPDNFKHINDTYGHDVGDNSLRLFAGTLRSMLADNMVAIRYRGNEFAVVVPGMDTTTVMPFAKRLFKTMCAIDISKFIDGKTLDVPFSIGIAEYPHDAQSMEELAMRSNEILYVARDAGGRRIQTGTNT